jgi:hypothetical protein
MSDGHPNPQATVDGRAAGIEEAEVKVIAKSLFSPFGAGQGSRYDEESVAFSGIARKEEIAYLNKVRATKVQ